MSMYHTFYQLFLLYLCTPLLHVKFILPSIIGTKSGRDIVSGEDHQSAVNLHSHKENSLRPYFCSHFLISLLNTIIVVPFNILCEISASLTPKLY